MFSKAKLEKIKREYGKHSSWAIWDYSDVNNVDIIDKSLKSLHAKYVLIGLNRSERTQDWTNFHRGLKNYNLVIAFNSCEEIRGAYMTDLFMEITTDGQDLKDKIELKGDTYCVRQAKRFCDELKLVGIKTTSKFIIFGSMARDLYDKYFEKHFPHNKVYYLPHYSKRGTQKDWVENVWSRLGIQKNYDEERGE